MTRSVALGDFIDFRGQPWQVVDVVGADLVLRNLHDATESTFPLTLVLGDTTYAPHDPDVLPTFSDLRVFETIPEDQAAHARALYEHVVEVLSGVKPGQEGPGQPEYDPSLPIGQRLEAKSAELQAAGFKPNTVRALRRYIARYKAEGLAGFIDKRTQIRRTLAGRSSEELLDIMRECLAEQHVLSTGARSRVLVNTTIRARERGVPVPSRATLYRMLARLKSEKDPFALATTRRSQDNRPDRTWSMRNPTRPGELVEIDSNTLDVLVRYEDGTTGRPEMTLMIDVATRTIMAAVIVPNSTKAVDAALLLPRALAPLDHRPGWGESTRLSRSILPAGMIAPDEEIRQKSTAKPVIVPDNLTIDRGKVFVSQVFMEACRRLEVSVTLASPYSPTFKPHVERVFATINSGFTQFLTGYTGHGVHMRSKNVDEDAALPIRAVQDALDYWIVAYYQNHPHEGLKHPSTPHKRLTPNEAYTAMSAVAPPVHVTLERGDIIGFYPFEWRSVRADGVHLFNLRYDCEALHNLRGRKSGLGGLADNGWRVGYDPMNLSVVWVHDHENDVWIDVPMVLNDRIHGPFSADIARLAMKAARNAQSAEDARRGPHLSEIVDQINRMLDGYTRTAPERAAVRRAERGVTGDEADMYSARPVEAVPDPVNGLAVPDDAPGPVEPRRRKALPPEEF